MIGIGNDSRASLFGNRSLCPIILPAYLSRLRHFKVDTKAHVYTFLERKREGERGQEEASAGKCYDYVFEPGSNLRRSQEESVRGAT